jgi:hypothetical protein
MKRLIFWLGGTTVVYLAILVVAGWLAPGCAADRIEQRLAGSLDAEVTVGDVELGLIGGHVTLRDLRIVRDQGAVDIAIDRVDAEIASLGRVLWDRDLGEVRVRGVAVTVTGSGAVGLRGDGKAEPVRMRSLRLEDVELTLMPTALLPGLGRVEVHLERAVTGPLVLRNALSWVFALGEIHAVVDVGGASAEVDYTSGQLRVGAGLFGAKPLTVPFRIPEPDPDALELDQLKTLAIAVGKAIGPRAAGRWLRNQLLDRFLE